MEKGINNSLTLINLLKFDPATTKILALLIVALPVAYFVFRIWYPCVTSASLLKTVACAKDTFDKCLLTDSFDGGEYDGYNRRLHRITARALEITIRSPNSRKEYRRHFTYPTFVWKRFSDIIECHGEARSLVGDLRFSLVRTFRDQEEYALVRSGHRVDDVNHLV